MLRRLPISAPLLLLLCVYLSACASTDPKSCSHPPKTHPKQSNTTIGEHIDDALWWLAMIPLYGVGQ